MTETYPFRREDNGEIVEVPFETMIQHRYGWITLEDGVEARRVHREERKPKRREVRTGSREIVSDALGFGQHQFDEMEADRRGNGFDGVEFRRDPSVPEFFQVKCSSRAEFNKYMRHRGFEQRTGIGGVMLSEDELRRAEAWAKERYDAD